MVSVCFVCLGNICRSPTAEGVFRSLVAEAGLDAVIRVDSAGTAGYHAGDPPDARACKAAARRGIQVQGRARQFLPSDFDEFDYVLVMDRSNLAALSELYSAGVRARLSLLRAFDPTAPKHAAVPDPYYGGDDGFDEVLDQCLRACRGLLEHIKKEHGL
jgi:protein-tyrosine phosphatase